jgi:hypothetical protein
LDSGARQIVKHPEKNEELNFEPMLDYRLPNIASGATPIGSAERAPDGDEVINIGDEVIHIGDEEISTTWSTK